MSSWGCPDCGLIASQGSDTLLLLAGAPGSSREPESRSPESQTESVPACAPEGCWCPRASLPLPLDDPCRPRACANGSTSGLELPGASCVLWKEFLFSVPAGPPAQYAVCAICLPPAAHPDRRHTLHLPCPALALSVSLLSSPSRRNCQPRPFRSFWPLCPSEVPPRPGKALHLCASLSRSLSRLSLP